MATRADDVVRYHAQMQIPYILIGLARLMAGYLAYTDAEGAMWRSRSPYLLGDTLYLRSLLEEALDHPATTKQQRRTLVAAWACVEEAEQAALS
jgi:hypothetical protein